MTIPFLLAVVLLQSQQHTDLDQIHQDLQQQRQQLERMLDLLDRQQQPQKPVCSAEIQMVNRADQRTVPLNSATPVPMNLVSVVSRPMDACLPADLRVIASYLDVNDNLICSGIVEDVAVQNILTQSINLEIQPWNLRDFVRWRNEPPQTNTGARRLYCINADGLAEARSEDLERIASVRVRAILLPRGGGMSTAEILLNLQR